MPFYRAFNRAFNRDGTDTSLVPFRIKMKGFVEHKKCVND